MAISDAEQAIVRQIVESGLPSDTAIFGNIGPHRTSGRSPLEVFKNIGFTPGQAEFVDPRLLSSYLEEITQLGKEYPRTLRGLSGIYAMGNRGMGEFDPVVTHPSAPRTRINRHWKLGIPTLPVGEVENRARDAARRGFLVGGGLQPFPDYFADFPGSVATHEFGHAVDRGVYDWMDYNKQFWPEGYMEDAPKAWRDLRTQLMAGSIGTDIMPSRYAQKSAQNQIVKIGRSYARLGETDNSLAAVLRAIADERVPDPKDLERIAVRHPVQGYMIGAEPMAETFSAGNALKMPGAEPNIGTAVGKAKAREFKELIPGLRQVGYEPFVEQTLRSPKQNLKLFAKGLPYLAGGIAAEYGAGQLPKGLLRELATGAARGAGYGSIAGAPGAIAGAGLGALISQLHIKRPKTGTPLDWL